MDGPQVHDMGVMFPTRMTIIKLSNEELWLDSPIPLRPGALKEVQSLGKISDLVVGTPRHLWRLESWHSKFPYAKLWGPPQTRGNVIERSMIVGRTDLPFTGILNNSPPNAWARDINQLVIEGNPLIREVAFFHKKSHTLILDDIIQRYLPEPDRPLRNMFFRLEGIMVPDAGVPGDIRLTFTDRAAARRSIRKLMSWDFDRLIIAHGMCIKKDANSFVRRAFEWLGH